MAAGGPGRAGEAEARGRVVRLKHTGGQHATILNTVVRAMTTGTSSRFWRQACVSIRFRLETHARYMLSYAANENLVA